MQGKFPPSPTYLTLNVVEMQAVTSGQAGWAAAVVTGRVAELVPPGSMLRVCWLLSFSPASPLTYLGDVNVHGWGMAQGWGRAGVSAKLSLKAHATITYCCVFNTFNIFIHTHLLYIRDKVHGIKYVQKKSMFLWLVEYQNKAQGVDNCKALYCVYIWLLQISPLLQNNLNKTAINQNLGGCWAAPRPCWQCCGLGWAGCGVMAPNHPQRHKEGELSNCQNPRNDLECLR